MADDIADAEEQESELVSWAKAAHERWKREAREDRRVDKNGLWDPPGGEAWTSAELLRARRVLFGWSQREVARRGGLTQAQVSRVEDGGDAKLSTLAKIAAALGCEYASRLRPLPGPHPPGPPSLGRGRRRGRFWRPPTEDERYRG